RPSTRADSCPSTKSSPPGGPSSRSGHSAEHRPPASPPAIASDTGLLEATFTPSSPGERRRSVVPVLALRIGPVRHNDQLVGDVVAVLLRPEGAPLAVVLEQPRCRLAEQPLRARVAVGDVDTGDLVVPVILEAG